MAVLPINAGGYGEGLATGAPARPTLADLPDRFRAELEAAASKTGGRSPKIDGPEVSDPNGGRTIADEAAAKPDCHEAPDKRHSGAALHGGAVHAQFPAAPSPPSSPQIQAVGTIAVGQGGTTTAPTERRPAGAPSAAAATAGAPSVEARYSIALDKQAPVANVELVGHGDGSFSLIVVVNDGCLIESQEALPRLARQLEGRGINIRSIAAKTSSKSAVRSVQL